MEQTGNKAGTSIKNYTGKEEKILLAFTLRFKGHTYIQIAQETGYNEHYLENQFCKGGGWHEQYKDWCKARTEDINQQVSTMFTAQALEAMQQIINISKGYLVGSMQQGDSVIPVPIEVKDSTVLKAAADVLDRAGFKPPEHITVESESEGMADSIFRRMEERRKLREAESKKRKGVKKK